jgi:16S rRNA (cytosine1402-N4)-methyltransferase
MDTRQEITAHGLVNGLDAKELARIFRLYGQERFSLRIARAIVRARSLHVIETTGELSSLVFEAIPRKFHSKRLNPATKVFQALRIAVNDELGNLESALTGGIAVLAKGGVFVVISFHSLEDRRVKDSFRQSSTGCICPPRAPMCVCNKVPVARLLTRRCVVPNPKEVESNPRARSAKLRAIEKL